MSLQVLAAGLIAFLAAALYLSADSGPADDTNAAGLIVPVGEFADSLTSLGTDQLNQRMLDQQKLIAMNQALLERLEAPEPIYATERSALPANRLEIAAYRADFKAYSAALAAAKNKLTVLQRIKEGRFTALQLQRQK